MGILDGFLNAGQKLLHIKNDNDKSEIKILMDTLEGQSKVEKFCLKITKNGILLFNSFCCCYYYINIDDFNSRSGTFIETTI